MLLIPHLLTWMTWSVLLNFIYFDTVRTSNHFYSIAKIGYKLIKQFICEFIPIDPQALTCSSKIYYTSCFLRDTVLSLISVIAEKYTYVEVSWSWLPRRLNKERLSFWKKKWKASRKAYLLHFSFLLGTVNYIQTIRVRRISSPSYCAHVRVCSRRRQVSGFKWTRCLIRISTYA